jgi:hypothetical protein
MDLSKHANQYLSEGSYKVTVRPIGERDAGLSNLFQANSGNRGIEFVLEDEDGATTKASFMLVDKSLWVLASFAKACGLSKDELEKYDHEMLVGREVMVRVVRDGQYHKVDTDNRGWWKVGAQEPSFSGSAQKPRPAATAAATPGVPDGDNDLPF